MAGGTDLERTFHLVIDHLCLWIIQTGMKTTIIVMIVNFVAKLSEMWSCDMMLLIFLRSTFPIVAIR